MDEYFTLVSPLSGPALAMLARDFLQQESCAITKMTARCALYI